eukprot:TRINITY_DN2091_c0_g1_i1.p1 TRINITY_DN2091_c0_g1~~TRINITY_DN2091_c0_g1_i1.p1  ORF type:complete len:389 (-),score=94.16 TRINITY_DN2091_c0_g1_i1:163-1329(-)
MNSVSFLLLVVCSVAVQQVTGASVWTNATGDTSGLHIYLFDMGQADTQLIVFPSGFSILVDCCCSYSKVENIISKIQKYLGSLNVDIFALSHYHQDHIGTAYTDGIWAAVHDLGLTIGKKVIDRNSGTWKDDDLDGVCRGEGELNWKYMGQHGDVATEFMCWVQNPDSTKVYSKRETAVLCSTTQIDPPDALATVTITAANGQGVYTPSGDPIAANWVGTTNPPGENDFSIGLRVQYGDFVYSTSGDQSGFHQVHEEDGFTYYDEETTTRKRVGEVDVMKGSHHGINSATNANWVNTLKPTVTMFTVADEHPAQEVMDRLQGVTTSVKSQVYLTERGGTGINIRDAIVAKGDIKVFTSADGSTYSITTPNGGTQTYQTKEKTTPTCVV